MSPPTHTHINTVDVSRVTIFPVSMTTTCCCPPLICLPLPPSLPFPFSLPLSCLPSLCTLLVFQGQRGSQPDSEIETEIGVESGERRAITMGETTDRGRLEDKNPPDVVIVSTLHLNPLPRSTYLGSCSLIITLFRVNLEPKWPTTGCILPEFGVVTSRIFPAT